VGESEYSLEIGIDSFATAPINKQVFDAQALEGILERIELTDKIELKLNSKKVCSLTFLN